MHLADKSQAYRLVQVQLVASLVLSCPLLVIGWGHVFSALVGGWIAALTTALAVRRVFVDYQAQEPGKLLAQLYGAEIQKLILTGLLFGAVIAWVKPLSLLTLFVAYLLVQMVPILFSHFIRP